jgi:hypothetical protein
MSDILDQDKAERMGKGLLGFTPKPLGKGDKAYFDALGLTEQEVQQTLHEIRDGMSPRTRARNSEPQP